MLKKYFNPRPMSHQQKLVNFCIKKDELLQNPVVAYITEEDLQDLFTWSDEEALSVCSRINSTSDGRLCPWCLYIHKKYPFVNKKHGACEQCTYGKRHGICYTKKDTYSTLLQYFSTPSLLRALTFQKRAYLVQLVN